MNNTLGWMDTLTPLSNADFLHGATSGEVIHLIELSYEFIVSMREEIVGLYGVEEYVDILKNAILFTKTVLTYSDFKEFPNIMNNFHGFFLSNYMGDFYRSQGFYSRFKSENPDLDEQLKEIFKIRILISDKTDEEIQLLYKAYRIMIAYDDVPRNYELFK